MSGPPSILVCATEISGDCRGARLARELLRVAPGVRLYGLGGTRMRRASVDVQIDITNRGTVGWFDHWRDLPSYLTALAFWRREVRRKPDAVIVIDAPGISFPFARVARSAGVPVVYFVTPQTWLWNPTSAVRRLRTHADLVIPALGREAEIYKDAGLPVIYEGHPALDDLLETYGDGRVPAAGAGESRVTVGIVPGSRRHAVRRLLPVMLGAIERVRETIPALHVLAAVDPAMKGEVARCLRRRTPSVDVGEETLPGVLRQSHIALASTGGNLLDAAFANVPAVACYRVDALTAVIARRAMRLHTRITSYALPNVVAAELILPELIQDKVTPEALADAALKLLLDRKARDQVVRGYGEVRAALGQPGVNARIASQLVMRLGLAPAVGHAAHATNDPPAVWKNEPSTFLRDRHENRAGFTV